MKYYRVSEKVLKDLLMDANVAIALEGAGVDNWEWYCEAKIDYLTECGIIDFTTYESFEELVEADLKHFDVCTCAEKEAPTFDEIVELLPFE